MSIAPLDGKSCVSGPKDEPLRRATIPEIFAQTVSEFGEQEAAVFSEQEQTLHLS